MAEFSNAERVKKHDFVEIEYTGFLENGVVFDTTDKSVAEKNRIYNPRMRYGPIAICVGERHLLPGIDKNLEGRCVGEKFRISIAPEEGFGKKNIKLVQLVPLAKFRKQNVRPVPGLEVNIDGEYGIIKNVSGGRVLVDFNHPLAGQKLEYDIKINRILKDDKEKIKAMLELKLNMRDFEIEFSNGKAVVKTAEDPGFPKEFASFIRDDLVKIIPSLKEIEFVKAKE